MPKPSRKAAAAKSLMQKSIITITEEPDGRITLGLSFKPAVRGDVKMTPAVAAGVEMLEWFTKEQARRKKA